MALFLMAPLMIILMVGLPMLLGFRDILRYPYDPYNDQITAIFTLKVQVFDVVYRGFCWQFEGKKRGVVMDWATRVRVALGSARELAYLHEDCHPRIIHHDITASNILLDNNVEAQVC